MHHFTSQEINIQLPYLGLLITDQRCFNATFHSQFLSIEIYIRIYIVQLCSFSIATTKENSKDNVRHFPPRLKQ